MKKKITQKIALGAVALAIATPTVVATVHHVDAAPTLIPESELTYTTLGNGTLRITKYTGSGGDVKIPSTIAGKQVTSIGDSAFYYKNLTSVIIPEGIKDIGVSTFQYNNLTAITIPDSVTSVGTFAFGNNKLTSAKLSEGLKNIGVSAFRYNALTSVTIPQNVTSIFSYAFENNKLTSIKIPEAVTNISISAFKSNSLEDITLPSSLRTIENTAFSDNKLTSVTIPEGVTKLSNSVFEDNQLTQVRIQNSATEIGSYTFKGNQVNPANLTIYGNDPSTAKTYATTNFHPFKPLSEWVDTTQPETEPIKTKSKWVTIVPSITVTGGKPVNAITIKGVEWETSETITTELGKIILSPDSEGNTIINIPDGLGTTATDKTIRVEVAEETFLDITVKSKPVITFSF